MIDRMDGKIEILAPAGGKEQLTAAIRCGADAVYLGMRSFSARGGAENFDAEELAGAVAYCHGRGAAVHVAVNTVVMDQELASLEKTADAIAASGADAVILQDLAAVRLFREKYPSIRRHASTQAAVHNLEGALWAGEMGFDRVVLARELSLEEIRGIASAAGIECEVFVHGALCMCVSGTCYLSSALGGRSGNRGRCAQPCRLNFSNGEREYALSLRDMSCISHIAELREAGAVSLKIEGRLKRPEYVAAAVTACRNAAEGKPWDGEALRAVFSRNGFTDGYLTGKRGAEMFGRRDDSAVGETNAVLGTIRELYRRERCSVPVDMEIRVRAGEKMRLCVSDGERAAETEGVEPEPALNRPADALQIKKSMEKTGGTPFFLRNFTADIGSGLAAPASALNSMRREALEKLLAAREELVPAGSESFSWRELPPHRRKSEPALWARFERSEQICRTESLERIILPAEVIAAEPELAEKLGGKLSAQLPFLAFPDDEARVSKLAEKLKSLGVKRVQADNVYAVRLGNRLGFEVGGGFGLNITNSEALEEYCAMGLSDAIVSIELPAKQIAALRGELPRGIIAYGHLPLMRFRCCPAKKSAGCGGCDGRPEIRDRYGESFGIVCSQKRYMSLLNPVPLDIADKYVGGEDFRVLYFNSETRSECGKIISRFEKGEKAEGKHTGMYFSKLL